MYMYCIIDRTTCTSAFMNIVSLKCMYMYLVKQCCNIDFAYYLFTSTFFNDDWAILRATGIESSDIVLLFGWQTLVLTCVGHLEAIVTPWKGKTLKGHVDCIIQVTLYLFSSSNSRYHPTCYTCTVNVSASNQTFISRYLNVLFSILAIRKTFSLFVSAATLVHVSVNTYMYVCYNGPCFTLLFWKSYKLLKNI